MKLLCIITLTIALSLIVNAQQAQPDKWKGLILDESTPEDAIQLIGQPKESKPQKIRIQKIGDWLGKGIKEELPHLRWERVLGMKSVDAYFLDGKLIALELMPKVEVRAAALESIYGVEFKHLISNAGRIAAGPGAYQRDRGDTFSNKDELLYHVGAKAERSFLVAWCEVGFGEGLKKAYGAGTDDTRPGKVRILQMYSRRVENRDGVDALSSEPSATPLASSPSPQQSAPAQAPASAVRPTPAPDPAKKNCFENGRKVPCP